jgi:hypothetical protein
MAPSPEVSMASKTCEEETGIERQREREREREREQREGREKLNNMRSRRRQTGRKLHAGRA